MHFAHILQRTAIVILVLATIFLLRTWLPVAADSAGGTGPDLIIKSITVNPPNPGNGAVADIAIVIRNQGDAPANGFYTYLYVDPSEMPPLAGTASVTRSYFGIDLLPDTETTFTRTEHEFTSDQPFIVAYVDPPWEDRVQESNEANNLKSLPELPPPTPTSTPTATSTPTPGGSDAYEPDNRCSNVKTISTDGVQQVRNLYRDNGEPDLDFIAFEATAGATYYIEAIAVGADADIKMGVLTNCINAPPLGSGAKITFPATRSGTHYIAISHNKEPYGPATDYRLQITTDLGCAEAYQSNNNCPNAGYLPLDETQQHAFCQPDKTDWFKFTVTAGARYRFITEEQGANVTTELLLTDSCERAPNPGNVEEFPAAKDGVYFVQVANQQQGAHGAGTEYTVRLEKVSDPCVSAPLEPNDTREDATALTIGTAVGHTFCKTEDIDWASFAAVAGRTYTIETFGLQADSDTRLCLLDSTDNELACDDDSGEGKGSRLHWTAPADGTFYSRVQSVDVTNAGSTTAYQLRVIAGQCLADSFEPDNERSTARALEIGQTQNHNICPQADKDFVKINPTLDTPYLIRAKAVGNNADPLLELYDADGIQLAANDDNAADGSAQLAYTFGRAGDYYVQVRIYNSNIYGTGTEYQLSMSTGTPTPPPTTQPAPTATPTPTPPPNVDTLKTLILVNRARMVTLHGEAETAQLMDKLDKLARHARVSGALVQLENIAPVRDAYTAWEADQLSVPKANVVADTIREAIWQYVAQNDQVAYLVLVGDDRALPFYRVKDRSEAFFERTYTHDSKNHPTGAAQQANFFLSDDYYADQEATVVNGQELFLPDLAVGRLIETPSDMIGLIDAFIEQDGSRELSMSALLVTGWDFVADLAAKICAIFRTDLGNDQGGNCELIGNNWTITQFRQHVLNRDAPYRFQMIAGHAAHYGHLAPDYQVFQAEEIFNTDLDWSGGLFFSPACHAGLNLPAIDTKHPLDLAEAYAKKKINGYIGHTGYGWGSLNGIGWSEQLLLLYTNELLKGGTSSMAQPLVRAKRAYYQQQPDLDVYDEKILQSMVFYGLPMFELITGLALSGDEEFPGVDFPAALAGPETITSTQPINFTRALNNPEWFVEDDQFYTLNGHISTTPGTPIQPLHHGQLGGVKPVRGIVLRSATYTQKVFVPRVAAPDNEYTANDSVTAARLAQPIWASTNNVDAWYPAHPSTLRTLDNRTTLVTQVMQSNPASGISRTFDNLQWDIYYSDSADTTPPTVNLVTSVYAKTTGTVQVKVGATDEYGVQRVVVAVVNDGNVQASQGSTTAIEVLDLTFDAAQQMWRGAFAGTDQAVFYVYVVDNAGNVTTLLNKGRYFHPGATYAEPGALPVLDKKIYLPLVSR